MFEVFSSKYRIATIYSLIWSLYYLQGLLYPEGIIAQLFLLVFLLISLYYAYSLNREFKLSPFMKSVNWLVILFGVYGLIRIIFPNTDGWLRTNDSTTYFKEYVVSILPIYTFYYLSRKGKVTEDWFYHFVWVFLLVSILQFYRESIFRLSEVLIDQGGVTNNSGYLFMSIIPCAIFLRRMPLYQFLFIIISVIFVIASMKRGAILISAISIAFLLPGIVKTMHGRQKIWVMLLIIITLVAGYYYVVNIVMQDQYFQFRLERTLEGDASNREDMYPMYFNFFFNQSSILSIFFGNGADGTLHYMGDFAHNDWLELLINQGLLGILLYITYWYRGYKVFKFVKQNNCIELALLIGLILMSYFAKSFISMSINGMALCATSAIGYALAKTDEIKKLS